jgi:hypothetical protein
MLASSLLCMLYFCVAQELSHVGLPWILMQAMLTICIGCDFLDPRSYKD